jgi:hypothetical protein
MITRTTLTKQEKEKLDVIKSELVGKFRKRVTPVFKRADGTIEPIHPKPKSPWQWVISPAIAVPFGNAWSVKIPPYMAPSLEEVRRSTVIAARRIDQLRGITYNTFIQRLIDDLVKSMGIPPEPAPLGRGTVTIIPPPQKTEWTMAKPTYFYMKPSVQAGKTLMLMDSTTP